MLVKLSTACPKEGDFAVTDPATRAGVIVVGSLTVDLTSFSDRLPSPGETVLGTHFTMVAGGKGGNQALASARMGAPTWMVGCVGDDAFRPIVAAGLSAGGVHAEHVRTVPGSSTGIAHIRVDSRGDNNIVMIPLANAELGAHDVDAALAALRGRVAVALVQLEIPIDVALHAVRGAKAAGLVTVLDPAPAPLTPLADDVYPLLDVVTPNETEASLLTGVPVVDQESAQAAGEWFVARGCATAIITLGAEGSVIVRGDKPARMVRAASVESIDTTAAGDAFTGAFGSRLALGDGIDTALTWATAAGGLATTVNGASSSIPNLDAVRVLVQAGRRSRSGQLS
jgi:ribokinase